MKTDYKHYFLNPDRHSQGVIACICRSRRAGARRYKIDGFSRQLADAVPLQTVYGPIACIWHDVVWGDRMYGTKVSGRGTASEN
ncbi:MAG: hypothetical protein EBE86_020730 [Hormoscilla sp. GUM202]|nr:hypothetical protein [Hormoscilla sp. GUM202]